MGYVRVTYAVSLPLPIVNPDLRAQPPPLRLIRSREVPVFHVSFVLSKITRDNYELLATILTLPCSQLFILLDTSIRRQLS